MQGDCRCLSIRSKVGGRSEVQGPYVTSLKLLVGRSIACYMGHSNQEVCASAMYAMTSSSERCKQGSL